MEEITTSNNDEFILEVRKEFGDFCNKQVEMFFDRAVKLAEVGDLENAEKLVTIIAMILRYCKDIGYEITYIFGFICHLKLNLDKPEEADSYFNLGMEMIKFEGLENNEDVDRFLNLKIEIQEKKKELKDSMIATLGN